MVSKPTEEKGTLEGLVKSLGELKSPFTLFSLVTLTLGIVAVRTASVADQWFTAGLIFAMLAVSLGVGILGVWWPNLLFRTIPEPGQVSVPVFIRNKRSGKYLDVTDWNDQDGAGIQQFSLHGHSNQVWRLDRVDNEHFRIISKFSKKCIAVPNKDRTDGVQVIQQECSDDPSQHWRFKRQGHSSYVIMAKHSQKALYVLDSSKADNAAVIQMHCPQGDAQEWILEVADINA